MDTTNVPKSSKGAFETNTVPTVRAIEQQLRAGVLRDKERLRALVGGNYRDLLSTADEIVTLNQRTKEAETNISELGKQCKPPQLQGSSGSVHVSSFTAAQLRLIIQCITCASTSLQNRSVLLCAQLTVVSRLLLKSLGGQQPQPKSLEGLTEKVAALRRRLLRLVRSHLAHPASSIDSLVDAICAYCLVTSASSGDAVKHFREVRLERLRQRIDAGSQDKLHMIENFRYLIVSVQLLRSLLGRSVNDALSSLQKQSILQEHVVLKLEALDIDRLRGLIPQDILDFTPYIKRVLLKQGEIQQISSNWIQEACHLFAEGLESLLAVVKSIPDCFSLRKDLCSLLLPVFFQTNGQKSLLTTVRQAINARVLELCDSQIKTLIQVGHTIALSKPLLGDKSSVWDVSLVQTTLVSNNEPYARQIQSSYTGTGGGLLQSIKKIRIWSKHLTQLRTQIQALEQIRWQDILEEPDDEDEEVAQHVIAQLSKDDPEHFKDVMERSVQSAVSEFNKTMNDSAVQISSVDGTGSDIIARIVYLLRALRESSLILTYSVPGLQFETSDLASKLHEALGQCVTEQIMLSLKQSTSKTMEIPAHPEDMPSPQAFKLLRDVSKIMVDVGGTDIWSAAALSKLKDNLLPGILKSENRSTYILNNFDEHFLVAALSNNPVIPKDANSSDTESKARAYWQRTRLLFGILSQ